MDREKDGMGEEEGKGRECEGMKEEGGGTEWKG